MKKQSVFIGLMLLFYLFFSWEILGLDPNKSLNQYYFELYQKKDGLPQNNVYSVIQNEDGYLLFATQEGFVHYDGINFKVFDSTNLNGLKTAHILFLFESMDHSLWIGTNAGLFRFFNGQITESYDKNTGLPNNIAYSITQTPDGNIWVGTSAGLTRIKDKKVTVFTTRHGLLDNRVNYVFTDRAGTLWIATIKGINYIKHGCKIRAFKECLLLSEVAVKVIQEDKKGYLWFGTVNQGLIRIKDGKLTQYGNNSEFSFEEILTLCPDKDGNLWIGSIKNRLYRFRDGRIEVLKLKISHHDSAEVLDIVEDKEGSLWLGTSFGLARLMDTPFSAIAAEEGLSADNTWSILEDKKSCLWIGTSGGGVNKLSPDGTITTYIHSNNRFSNTVYSLYLDKNDTLWLGYRDGLGQLINGTIRDMWPPSHHRLPVYSITEDNSGNMLLGTGEGVKVYKNGAFISFSPFTQIPSIEVRAIHEDKNGDLWVVTNGGGVYILNGNNIAALYNTGNGFPSDNLCKIYEDRYGVIWICSLTNGLIRVKDKKYTVYNNRSGLFNDAPNQVIEDNNGVFWIGCNKGLFTVPRKELEEYAAGIRTKINSKVYDRTDGMKGEECNGGRTPGACKTNNGILWFPTERGVVRIDPSRIKPNLIPPPLIIESFISEEKKIDLHTTELNSAGDKAIVLPPGVHNFEINYTALSFQKPHRITFKYRLEGFETEYIDAGSRRVAYYTNISPGYYTFYVNACNSDGIWNKNPLRFSFYLSPRFFQTSWFQGLVGIFILSFIYLGYKWRLHRIQHQKKFLEDLVRQRTNELQIKKSNLEKLDKVSTLINMEIDFQHLINAIMGEVFEIGGVEKAFALIHDKNNDSFSYKASIGWNEPGFDKIVLLPHEVHERYCVNSQEIVENVYLIKDVKSRPHEEKIKHLGISQCMLVIKSVFHGEVIGYLVFDNMEDSNAFNTMDLDFLRSLKKHVDIALGKIKLLMELQEANAHLDEARRHAEEERKKATAANKAKSEFLAKMSHEIRTPLNSIIGFTEMLMDAETKEEQRDFIRTIENSCEILLSLINDILDFSKIEAGFLTFETIDFDPELTIYNTCELIVTRLEKKPVELICTIGENVPASVQGDPVRFRQVVLNLLGNASKFTDKGEIVVSLNLDEEDAGRLKFHVRIQDTGCGIPEDKLSSIFDAFQQVDGSITRKYGGTGLGLSISKQIARLMEGDVWAESQLGKGSTFHFTGWVKKSATHHRDHLSLKSLEGKKIVFVEVNKNNRNFLERMLSKEKLRVTSLVDPHDVIPEIIKAIGEGDPYDLCILDILMPGINGYQLAKEICELEDITPKPVLLAFSTAYGKHAHECYEAGFSGFLPKPVQRDKLLRMIHRLLAAQEDNSLENGPGFITQHSLQEEAKHSTRILLAEDNPINQKLAVSMLTKAGYIVEVASNGKIAVEMVQSKPDYYNLILMDVQMIEMNGLEATVILREKGYTNIPIIAMTAGTMTGDKEKCLAAGMNDYISKPIKREIVFEMIRKWLLK